MNADFKNWSLEKRIIATIAYFELFDINLNLFELKRVLLGNSQNINVIKKTLRDINEIHENKGVYYFNKKPDNSFRKDMLVEKYWRKINHWKRVFKFVPFARFVAVCNYISFGSIKKNSDIDVLIVVRKGKIFTAKYFATIMTQIFGVRRHGRRVKKRFCLSFFIAEDNLNFEQFLLDRYDVYFAYWLMGLVPLYGSSKVWQAIGYENNWIEKYFEHFQNRRVEYKKVKKFKDNILKKGLEYALRGKLGTILENRLKKYGLKRYKKSFKSLPENASVIVNDKVLKYHNNDQRDFYRKKFEQALQRSELFR